MGWCINKNMKKALLLILCILITSCASKPFGTGAWNCTVTGMQIKPQGKNILISLLDNSCGYNYEQIDAKSWKISLKRGKIKSHTPYIDNVSSQDILDIHIDKKEIIFDFAKNGVLTQQTRNTFLYKQNNFKAEIPAEKALYIERVDCYSKSITIKSNGALHSNYGVLYNGQKYLDIYNVPLKKGYKQDKKCRNISSPVKLAYPERIRYFINNIESDLSVHNTQAGILLSYDNSNNFLITDIYEENTPALQKIILETSSNIRVLSVNSDKNNTTVVLEGKYRIIKNSADKNKFLGKIFKNMELKQKAAVTEIKFNNKSANIKNYISIDRVDNKLIIYATKL